VRIPIVVADELQEQRNSANDPSVKFRISEAQSAIATARTVIESFNAAGAEQQKSFAAVLVCERHEPGFIQPTGARPSTSPSPVHPRSIQRHGQIPSTSLHYDARSITAKVPIATTRRPA